MPLWMQRGEAGVALRIGVNAGSLERTVAERDDLTLPEKLLASSLQFVEHIEGRGFTQMVLSAKAHDVTTTIETYRALSCTLPQVPSPSWRYGGRYPFPGNHQELRGG